MTSSSHPLPAFQKRDLDGFFGLFIDNLVQLLSIVALCSAVCGMSGENASLLTGVVLPGAAVSLLVGNLFYAWQARQLAKREQRSDVTALPYGINTPSLLVYVFFVMLPVYAETEDAEAAWRAGLVACFGSGVIELLGAFVAGPIRRYTPRAALLATLSGIAIGFISMIFALKIYARPLIGLVPLAVMLATLFGRVRFVGGLPGGFLAVLSGTALAWLATGLAGLFESLQPILSSSTMPTNVFFSSAADPSLATSLDAASKEADGFNKAAGEAVVGVVDSIGFYLPQWSGGSLWKELSDPTNWQPFITVIVPMGIFNLIGSLQNLESAEAAGDRYPTAPSLAANGTGTIVAALFGSCFPTTIYIGHPGWKSLGAGAGYSTLNGIVVTLMCSTGLVGLTAALIPLEAGAAIVLWIGVVIAAQAFTAVPKNHAPAVALALFPSIAAFGATVMYGAFIASGGSSIQDLLTASHSSEVNGFSIHAFLLMERGYIFVGMIWGAAGVALIERKPRVAAVWTGLGAVLTWSGMIHAYQVVGGNVVDSLFRTAAPLEGAVWSRADDVLLGYLLVTGFLLALPLLAPDAIRPSKRHEEQESLT